MNLQLKKGLEDYVKALVIIDLGVCQLDGCFLCCSIIFENCTYVSVLKLFFL